MRFRVPALLLALMVPLASCGREEPGSTPNGAGSGTNGAKEPRTTRKGAWVDQVVFVVEPDAAKAVGRIESGDIQLYGLGVSEEDLYRKIQSSEKVTHTISYGLTAELTLNPVGPTFPATGKLNPFSVAAIREALNRLVDRKYIAEEIYGGLAVPRWLPLNTAFPDYARLADAARALEIRYSHDPAAARETIAKEMKKLGAEQVNGKWTYDGEPVEIIVLIRTEDRRREVGDYVANLLEKVGFKVDRQYKNAQEASRLWIQAAPGEGKWHVYTGGWISTFINRDEAGNFSSYYTKRGRPDPLWQAYDPSKEFDDLADRLQRRDYKTWDERQKMMARAMELALAESFRVWLVDQLSVWPRSRKVELAADLAGGVSGSSLWPYTLRYTDREGGTIVLANKSLLTGPWNPVVGSNWIYDTMVQRATGDPALLPDPFTGLYLPQRIESATVTVLEGTPVIRSLDWVKLNTAESIEVPKEAWIDWDPKEGRFITVGEKYPDGLKARVRVRVEYSRALFKIRWHDGSKMSLADLVVNMALPFARATEGSPLFDEGEVPSFQTFLRHFRGWNIVQKDPLIVETYSDQIFPDAEVIVANLAPGFGGGFGPWHTLAPGIYAETEHRLAFSSHKADRLKVPWANYVAGETLKTLEEYLERARKEKYVPLANALKPFVNEGEVERRYGALAEWYKKRNHFWVGNGPFFLASVHPTEKNVVIERNPEFPDPADKWVRFTRPRIPQIAVRGPMRVVLGSEATFDLSITFEGEPYPTEDLEFVRYLVFNGRGQFVFKGEATRVAEGRWRIRLGREEVKKLGSGANRLEIAVSSKRVALPAFETASFATIGR